MKRPPAFYAVSKFAHFRTSFWFCGKRQRETTIDNGSETAHCFLERWCTPFLPERKLGSPKPYERRESFAVGRKAPSQGASVATPRPHRAGVRGRDRQHRSHPRLPYDANGRNRRLGGEHP